MKADVQEGGGARSERLSHVGFRLFCLGEGSRADILGRFDAAPTVAMRDLARYRTLAPNNIRIDGGTKTYPAIDDFRPLFEHSLDRVLSALPKSFGGGLGGAANGLVPCEYPAPITRPVIDVLAAVIRAISGRRALSVPCVATEREIVSLALADNGLRWLVRAFDQRMSSFRDFVLMRIRTLWFVSDARGVRRSRHPMVPRCVPDPDFPRPELAALDYPMTDGVLRIRAGAALVGYVLRQWSVDCSEGHSLRGPEYRLWLRNRVAREGVDSASIALGYLAEEHARG